MAKKVFSISASILLLLMVCVSCSDNEDKDTLPELPPSDALLMDFSDFANDPSKPELLKSLEGYTNFLHAYGNVLTWSLISTVYVIVPAVAYAESFNHTPVYLGDNSWQWSYTVGTGGDALSARLVTKRISNDEYTAEFYLSQGAGGQEFKWFNGTVMYNRTKASWTLYDPQTSAAYLDVEWNKDWDAGTSDLTYTVTAGTEKDSYITLGITTNTDYDSYYTISNTQKTTYIEWNSTTKVGRVKDEVKFGDADWRCWDQNLMDVDCN